MLSAAKNERLTQSGPATPGGALLRRYWQPAALVEELQGARPVKAVTLLGEDLVVFRDDDGAYGLIGRKCPHRGADLCYGRLENGGLRCTFHGWLFDRFGRCLEQPAEPPDSNFHRKIAHRAYPSVARNGIVFAYLGPGEPPPFPDYECFRAPDAFTFAFKGFIDCNWLQALEVGIDPAHASFLHRFFEDEEPAKGYGRQFRAATADAAVAVTRILRDFPRPEIEVDETIYGLRIYALRDIDEGRRHIRVTNLAFPQAIVIPMSDDMVINQWHVPIDDRRCWWYAIFSAYGERVDKETMRRQRLELYSLPDYKPRLNRDNNYGFDAEEQRTQTYTGMGSDINVHDQWAVESLGPIADRTNEHLGASDKAITAYRRQLLQAIDAVDAGGEAPMTFPPPAARNAFGPIAVDTIGPAGGWREHWQAYHRERIERSPWAAP